MLSNPIQSAIRLPVRSALGSAVFGPAVFDPASLFSSGSAGAWYDPSDFSTLYQTSTGTTPVTAVEQPVGLMLDRSRGLVLGSELVTNGDFSSSAGWTVPAGWTISGGAAQVNTPTATTNLYRNALTATKVYLVTTVVSEVTAGSVRTFIGSNSYTPIYTAPGTYLAVLRANSNGNIGLENDASFVGAVDSISARELPGNHATQDTSTSRPVLRARYNLLTFSEQFDNGAWTKTGTTVSANAGVAPDGTTTADKWQETAGGNGHVINRSVSVITGTQYTFSVYAKAGENNYVGLFGLKNSVGKFFNLSTGAVGNNIGSAPASATIESVGNGWYRCSITDTETATTSRNFEIYSSKNGTNWDYSGTLNDGILIWGAQLLTAADQTSTGGAYQRIAAATDYDTSNPVWRPYLAFDGVDDHMTLASAISITTDMTVVRGFGRSAAGIHSLGFAHTAATPHAGTWNAGDNIMYGALGNAQGALGSASTATGYYVDVVSRNSITESARRNGTALGSRSAATVSGSLSTVGRLTTLYNNGPIYGLIVLDRELTGSELTDTEQWMAGKTGVPAARMAALQRLIALSPSQLIWPALGAGWQSTSGNTLAASGQPLGLGADLSQLQGKTLSEWLATAPELVTNGTFSTGTTAGWTAGFGATLSAVSGRIRITRGASDFAGARQTISGLTVGRLYFMQAEFAAFSGITDAYIAPVSGENTTTNSVGTISRIFFATATSQQIYVGIWSMGDAPGSWAEFDNISVKELPGNHLRAGTWGGPSDSARGIFQNDAINFDGVDDYYTQQNSINITTNMTVVRAFKRASAGIISVGVGRNTTLPRDGLWWSDNKIYPGLGESQFTGAADAGTGSFVLTTARNGSSMYIRKNGTSYVAGAAPTINRQLFYVGRGEYYNSGEISFLAIFPTELTGADLALVEQIAASTNGATLA